MLIVREAGGEAFTWDSGCWRRLDRFRAPPPKPPKRNEETEAAADAARLGPAVLVTTPAATRHVASGLAPRRAASIGALGAAWAPQGRGVGSKAPHAGRGQAGREGRNSDSSERAEGYWYGGQLVALRQVDRRAELSLDDPIELARCDLCQRVQDALALRLR